MYIFAVSVSILVPHDCTSPCTLIDISGRSMISANREPDFVCMNLATCFTSVANITLEIIIFFV